MQLNATQSLTFLYFLVKKNHTEISSRNETIENEMLCVELMQKIFGFIK